MTGIVLSLGSVNIDIAAYSTALPRLGETIHADRTTIGLGGKGANQAAAAARLAAASGLRVALAGRVGDDAFGTLARTRLATFGVDLSALRSDPDHPTGLALIAIDARGENAITVAAGANMRIDATDIEALVPMLRRTRVLLLQLETPILPGLDAARAVRATGGRVILDPAPAPDHALPDAAWSLADIMTPNETETERLVGLRPDDPASAAAAADRMLVRGLGCAIVKLGARGVFWRDRDGSGFIEPFPVRAIDSVAAGDCFNGGLAIALARGDAMPDAVRFAAACGALATTRPGAADAAPDLDAVHALVV